MAALIQLASGYIPAPLLWAGAGAASCCFGLCVGLYFVNPMAFEILMADEDDEEAQNNAIGPATLNMFSQCVLVSALLNGCVSLYDHDRSVNFGCCGLCFVVVSSLTAWLTFREVRQAGQEMAKERKQQERAKTK